MRAARSRALARRLVVPGCVLLALLALGLGGWRLWVWQQEREARAASGPFIAAMQSAAATTPGAQQAGRAEAMSLFARVAAEAPEGYRVLARLREAGLRAQAGELPAALSLWDQVAADGDADPLLRGFASLCWVSSQVDGGDPAVLRARLGPLLMPESPWHVLAAEQGALLDLRAGQDAPARAALRRIAADPAAPGGARQRAGAMLQSLGETPPAAGAAMPGLDG